MALKLPGRKYRLRNLKVDRVDRVESGANSGAEIVLYKNDTWESKNNVADPFARLEVALVDVGKAGKIQAGRNMERLKRAMVALQEIMGEMMDEERPDAAKKSAQQATFLPHHGPDGKLSPKALFAAAIRFDQSTASAADKAAEGRHLARHYRVDLKEEPPEVLKTSIAKVAQAMGLKGKEKADA